MLKLEIKLDEEKIREAGKYAPDSLRQTLIQAFAKQQLDSVVEPDGTLFFVGRGQARDYGCFGKMITTLKNQQWSGYHSMKKMTDLEIFDLVQEMAVRIADAESFRSMHI